MKKSAICVLILFVCCLMGCRKNEVDVEDPNASIQETHSFDESNFDWEEYLYSQAFDTSSAVGEAISDAVEISVDGVTETEIIVTVRAPCIYDALSDWYDKVGTEKFSDVSLETKILELLRAEKQTHTFTMPYSVVDNTPVLSYAKDYADVLSCGLTEFYDDLYERILVDLGGAVDG